MSYQSKFASKDIDLLFDAILKLENKEECYRLFEDLCTIKEVMDMAQRIRVAKLLDQKVPYHTIVDETHASTATISRVNKSLMYGADGYKIIIDRLKEQQKKKE
ncbi:MAG: TrpR-like protein YerC/YecD [Tenericutes bacterium HGW-Tenericutes-3]|nr:MAG: TrpR-like protein YerC/YecD [Tenericutes bacterium HGW-Tenericutes-3]